MAKECHGSPGGSPAARLDITLNSRLSEIGRANEKFNEFAEAHGVPEQVRLEFKVVFDELLNNIISYGYRDDLEHEIKVVAEVAQKQVLVTIADGGAPFNPFERAAPDTTQPLMDRREGGLGIHLVRMMMDQVAYERRLEENVVTLVKQY